MNIITDEIAFKKMDFELKRWILRVFIEGHLWWRKLPNLSQATFC